MSEFEREDRYAVIKYKKLTNQQWTLVPTMLAKFDGARVDCVVVEKDWPEYNFVWLMLEHRMAGYPVPDFNAVKCAADVAIAQDELETAKATIAQLETKLNNAINLDFERRAEIERLKLDHQHMVGRNALLRQRPDLPVDRIPAHNQLIALQAEIERLKGGLGEPVALPARSFVGDIRNPYRHTALHDGYISGWNAYQDAMVKLGPLFASQPAPVSVVLPERMPGDTEDSDVLTDCRNEGWNACLDKVKELNQ